MRVGHSGLLLFSPISTIHLIRRRHRPIIFFVWPCFAQVAERLSCARFFGDLGDFPMIFGGRGHGCKDQPILGENLADLSDFKRHTDHQRPSKTLREWQDMARFMGCCRDTGGMLELLLMPAWSVRDAHLTSRSS